MEVKTEKDGKMETILIIWNGNANLPITFFGHPVFIKLFII